MQPELLHGLQFTLVITSSFTMAAMRSMITARAFAAQRRMMEIQRK